MLFQDQFERFHDLAVNATGLNDFGNESYHGPMKLLLENLDNHAGLNELGIQSVSGEIIGFLIGRLKAYEGFKLHADAIEAPIKKPVFIVGLPRTGTTVLLRLLYQDHNMQSLPLWLTSLPMPRPPRETWESNPCYQKVADEISQLDLINPLFRKVHPMSADQPDECRLIMNHTFWSVSMASLTQTPEYQKWIYSADPTAAYRYYRNVLGLIANGDSRRWLLKDPTHLFSLDTLLATFPDACIVHTHREPLTAITSITNLIYLIRSKRENKLNPEDVGSFFLKTWSHALNKSEKIRQQHPNPHQFYDIHMNETRADPIGTIEKLYRHFGFDISEQTRQRWRRSIENDPSMGHSAHNYSPDFFGLTANKVTEAFADYYCRYNDVAANSRLRESVLFSN